MYVKDKIMYHFHNPDYYDDLWYEGNEINVDSSFNSAYFQNLYYNSSTGVKLEDGSIEAFNCILKDYLSDNFINKIYKIPKDELKDEISYIKKLLQTSFDIISNESQLHREVGLEEYRKENYPDLPSRKHSIWVCEKKQLEHWKGKLFYERILFKLSLTGSLFKSNEDLLPYDGFSTMEAKEVAYKYWNPNLENVPVEKMEYLFQGKVKILNKVKS